MRSFTAGERTADLHRDSETQWKSYRLSPGETLTFEQYERKVYHENKYGHSSRRKEQDSRRFHVCDENQDGGLDKDEFMTFLYSEEYPHMHDIVILETMEDMDKDGDGVLSYLEFTDEEEGMEEGRQAETTFKKLDKDGDGQLSRVEVKHWVLQPNLEASQDDEDSVIIVMDKLDTDKDEKLSRSEVDADPQLIEDQLMYEEDDDDYAHDEF
ncbi:calumenin-A-like [Branchiostoma lanceolatum]|uniref:calumenin-A-like n=1 Tax=Branchiostoma lanceolatum TaxID=7740 RepID=UPI0034553486